MILTLVAIIILWRRKDGIKRARVILGLAVVVLFFLGTADLCCTVAYYVMGLQKFLVDDAEVPDRPVTQIDTVTRTMEQHRILGLMHSILFPVAFVIGDAVVIWRACALSGKKKKIVFLLVILQLALTGAAFGWIGCYVATGMPLTRSDRCEPFYNTTFVLSVMTNIGGTAAIGYTSWSHWKAIREYFKSSNRPARAEKVTVLLVESGLFYIVLLIAQVVATTFPDSRLSYLTSGVDVLGISTQLVGIYPTALIVLVFLKRSLWEINGVPSGKL
ncbi:hypothetical protein AAF712_002848 [Marasmius tenuissimus]|uniref:Uncharacterized protein n=1 Tax=Marasmius tenuissimus TaxID=585030 RepID=A0ABR3A8M6_9AGAR